MNRELEAHSDDAVDLPVYLSLLVLTAATLGASMLHAGGRLMAVTVALIIASMKAGLIGFYFMNLRKERALMWTILAIGAVAVFILLVGILPDLTFARF